MVEWIFGKKKGKENTDPFQVETAQEIELKKEGSLKLKQKREEETRMGLLSRNDEKKKERKLFVKFEPRYMESRTEGPNPIFNVVSVNDDHHPVLINNEHFTGHAVFRCQNFDGWTPIDEQRKEAQPVIPTCEYFEGHKRTFSFQISGRFRKPWTADDVMFGTFFEKPLELPRGYSLALGIAKKIDPSMVAVLDTDKPYMCSPLICAMNTAHIQPLYANPVRRTISMFAEPIRPQKEEPLHDVASRAALDDNYAVEKPLTLPPWTYSGDAPILEENLMLNWPSWTTVPTASSFFRNPNSSLVRLSTATKGSSRNPPAAIRRHWFLDEAHRKKFIYHPDTVYSFDFASPYVDLTKMKLKLGISIDVESYLGDQPIRYECRSRDGKVLFFAVELGRA
jgi:hypothetical protein